MNERKRKCFTQKQYILFDKQTIKYRIYFVKNKTIYFMKILKLFYYSNIILEVITIKNNIEKIGALIIN